jgi:hypothetical protein
MISFVCSSEAAMFATEWGRIGLEIVFYGDISSGMANPTRR